jgi:hypothetical protein
MRKTFLLALIVMAACGKSSNNHSVVTPVGEVKKGNITGQVILFDAEGNQAADNSGVAVSADNTSINAKTAANGRWVLDSVPAGTYDVSYAKAGYGTVKTMGLNHQANNNAATNLPRTLALNAVSVIKVTAIQTEAFDANPTLKPLISAGLMENGVLIEPLFTNPTASAKPIRLFFSDKAGAGPGDYLATEKNRYPGKQGVSEDYNYNLTWFAARGFKPGQTVYVTAYGDGFKDDEYANPLTGLSVFPSLSAAGFATASFTLPLK